jgi:hypothetical protein
LFGLDLLPQLGDRDVSLHLNHGQHVDLHWFAHAARNAIARLGTACGAVVVFSLLANLTHIFPTHTKTLGKHTTTTLAALVRSSDPHPQIVGKCSSHPLSSQSIHQATIAYPLALQMGIASWIPL